MTKGQKQYIVIGVGVIILAVVILGNLSRKKKKIAPPANNVPTATLTTTAVGKAKYVPVDEEGIAAQKKHAELPWGRNPFLSDIEKGDQIAELKLQGISFGKDNVGFAFINNMIVKKGDKVGDYEVFEIFKDRVLLKKGNQSFYLVFPEE
jgi:hypothetical protein